MSEVDRLFQISNRTQTLVLERQRLAAFSPGSPLPTSQLNQIARNLETLRIGIQDVESRGYEEAETVKGLRQQWIRMREMLGDEDLAIQEYVLSRKPLDGTRPFTSYSLAPRQYPNPPKSPLLTTYSGGDPVHTPYADDPDSMPPSPPFEPQEILSAQRQMMEGSLGFLLFIDGH
ncbi:hypothetical protein FRC03_011851 [Tulasnella sp. 419]|nr:hypothetical protein FRC03_011851 [Tulasnella sp. 419]